jgi:hypothetical protein
VTKTPIVEYDFSARGCAGRAFILHIRIDKDRPTAVAGMMDGFIVEVIATALVTRC